MEHGKLYPRRLFMVLMSCIHTMAMGASITACSDDKQAVKDAVAAELENLKTPPRTFTTAGPPRTP